MQDNVNRWVPLLDWDSGKARPASPRVDRIVSLQWLNASSGSASAHKILGKRKAAEMDGNHSTIRAHSAAMLGSQSFLAVLDTHEVTIVYLYADGLLTCTCTQCLLFTEKPDQMPTISIVPMAKGLSDSTGDLLFAGSGSADTMVDAMGNIVPLPGTSASGSYGPAAASTIRHAAITPFQERKGDQPSRMDEASSMSFLVAYTSRPSLRFHRSQATSGDPSNLTGNMQVDPVAAANLLNSVRVDSMGNLQLPATDGGPATNLFPASNPLVLNNVTAEPVSSSSLGLLQSDGISGLIPPNQPPVSDQSFLNSLSLPVSYGDEMDMSALDEMFDGDFGNSTSNFGSALFGSGTGLQAESQSNAVDDSKLAVASPSKSVCSNAGSSPQKSTSGMPGAGNDTENATPRTVPEKLDGQSECDDKSEQIQLCELSIDWNTGSECGISLVK